LRDKLLVADLERIMTLEKPIVSGWTRVEGCSTDAERRLFAEAIVRKRQRFAFPNQFSSRFEKMRERFKDKHEKFNDEGRALRELREIRIRAEPGWEEGSVTLTFLFIKKDGMAGPSESLAESWVSLFDKGERFVEAYAEVTTLDDISARDYVESDRLDLDGLSTPRVNGVRQSNK
jgi:hypothetical protein